MQTVALIIHLLLALALIGVVLLQRSEGGGLGMGNTSAGLFSSRGAANALSRTTAVLGACFMGMSLFLAILAGQTNDGGSIFDRTVATPTTQTSPSDNALVDENAVPIAE